MEIALFSAFAKMLLSYYVSQCLLETTLNIFDIFVIRARQHKESGTQAVKDAAYAWVLTWGLRTFWKH